MKTKHLFADGIYHIGNKAVAKCFLFADEKDCIRFQTNIDHHLGPLCDVLAYSFSEDEFQLVVKLKDRKTIENYFKEKYAKFYQDEKFIPETTYIFAQAMANMQSGYAKYFNYRYDRDGGLMKGRYFRHLIESEEELNNLVKKVHAFHAQSKRSRIWTFRRKEEGFNLEFKVSARVRSSLRSYEEARITSGIGCFKSLHQIDLRGRFSNLPPKRLEHKKTSEKIRNLISFMFLRAH